MMTRHMKKTHKQHRHNSNRTDMFVYILPKRDRDIGTLQYEQSGRCFERLHDMSRVFQLHSVNRPLDRVNCSLCSSGHVLIVKGAWDAGLERRNLGLVLMHFASFCWDWNACFFTIIFIHLIFFVSMAFYFKKLEWLESYKKKSLPKLYNCK